MDWVELDQTQALEFIKAVADEKEPLLFEQSVCEVHILPLPFYDGYSLYRVVNKYMLPHLLLDYLSNGENHYYLDGSEAAFHNLNARGALSLDEDNVIDYLDLYISYVYERGNSLEFTHDKQEGHITKLLGSDEQKFDIEAPLVYQDRVVKTRIEIEKTGAIHVQEPLRVSFLTELKPVDTIPYRHPHEDKIIAESKALLEQTEIGKSLIEVAEKTAADLRVLCSPNYHGFIGNNLSAYIIMPAAEQSAKYMQAVVLAGCLRDIQQISDKYIHAFPGEDELLYATVNIGKNLDLVLEMCKIVEELENKGIPEGLLALQKLGLEPVYEGHKNKLDEEALRQVYMAALESSNIIKM